MVFVGLVAYAKVSSQGVVAQRGDAVFYPDAFPICLDDV